MTRAAIRRYWPAVFLCGYFFWFAGGGLRAQFTDNDLMNLNFHLAPSFGKLLLANLMYWTTTYRPMGGVVYAASYRLFGFTPAPLRVFCFTLLLANLALLYRVCARLAGSREIALLATLLVTYHAWFVDLYYSSGTIYELLCFALYFAAFLYYLRVRQQGRILRSGEWIVFLALYIAALDAKELAVTLPLAVGFYEWVWKRPEATLRGCARWLAHEGRGMVLSGAITVPYVIGKLTGPESLAASPLYRPDISAMRYLRTFGLYLNVLFYQDHFFRPGKTVILLALMLAAALWLHSRPMLFGWWFALFSVLPFIFVPHYSGFFVYLPAAGWALYVATALEMLRRGIAPRVPAVAVFVAVALALAPVHAAMSHKTMRVFESASLPTRTMTAALRRAEPTLPRGARVLFRDDPFPARTYWLWLLMRLVYDDPGIQIARTKDGTVQEGKYDAVLLWKDGRLTALP